MDTSLIVIFSVMVVFAALSLYDYFSTKNWLQPTADDRREEVFEHRNHEYGAYTLRRDNNKNLLIVMGAVIFSIGTAFGVYYTVTGNPEQKGEEGKKDNSAFALDDTFKKEEIIEPLEEEIPEAQKQIQFLAPVVSDDEPADEIQIVDPKDNVSDKTIDGNSEFGTDDPVIKVDPVIEEKKDPVIYDVVDEPADFPGGMAAARAYLGNNIKYPQTAVDMSIEGKCYLKFIVSESGNISNVKVVRGVQDCPECDAEAVRVIKSMPNWKPGKVNGKAVNSTFTLPVQFKLN
ncbi:MAG: energy transducer TonB [Fluviicola sp.]|jgi:protein TonB